MRAGTNGQCLRADAIEKALREKLPDYAVRALDEAFAGQDPRSCVVSFSNRYQGVVGVLFYLRFRTGQCSEADYQAVLSGIWDHDHRYLIQAAGSRRQLRAMFEAARFPLPTDLLETVQIWRGTCGMREEAARRGLAWTLARPVACWFATRFATRFADLQGRSLVLTAEVPRSALFYFSDERQEQEVLCFSVPDATVDGTQEDWLRAGEGYEAKL